jgi:hypothetical protein
LRTSLVYEIRVYIDDPDDRLRLGMPATVNIPLTPSAATADGKKPGKSMNEAPPP